MKFLDEARIFVQSGAGGNGCLSFRREANVEYGGPDGGDGGRGGHIYIEAVPNLNTLIDFRYQQHYKAMRGGGGMGKNKTGAGGDDIVIQVPVGTEILDETKEFVIADLIEPGARVMIAEGGRGGAGNVRFKSSTNRAPRRTTPGGAPEERSIWLHLKLLADVGLVGLPNAGKSTLLAATSKARPKIADYPFTTLTPQLGIVKVDERSFVLADIPGLIEGANEGVGLGDRFLGHVERCRVLVHLIDATGNDIVDTWHMIRKELTAYGTGLEEKEEIIALSKSDIAPEDDVALAKAALEAETGKTVFVISAATGSGLPPLLGALADRTTRNAVNLDSRSTGDGVETEWSPV